VVPDAHHPAVGPLFRAVQQWRPSKSEPHRWRP